MVIDELPLLEQALAERFPELLIKADTVHYGHVLRVSTAAEADDPADLRRWVYLSPVTMDFTALDWREWLHRATQVISRQQARQETPK